MILLSLENGVGKHYQGVINLEFWVTTYGLSAQINKIESIAFYRFFRMQMLISSVYRK